MKKIIIIGGGLAGLTTAFYLDKAKFEIELFERTPEFGGRAKSFYLKEFELWLDNGQHLMIMGYQNTIELLQKISAMENFYIQKEFEISFRDAERCIWKFTPANKLNFLMQLIRFPHLKLKEKILLLYAIKKLSEINKTDLKGLTAYELLEKLNQSDWIIKNFWSLFVESTLNSPLEFASAEMFSFVFKKMFVEEIQNSRLIMPYNSLYKSFIQPLKINLIQTGVQFQNGVSVKELIIEDAKVVAIKDNQSKIHYGDFFVLAVEPNSVNKLLKKNHLNFNYQSILNIHLIFDDYKPRSDFYALWNSFIHWAFFHKSHITLVRSVADEYNQWNQNDLIEIFLNEFYKFFPEYKKSKLRFYRVIKEKKATFISDLNSTESRPRNKTKYSNLFLSGDYTDTGLPSTIESAVTSGKRCAEILNELN